MRRKSAIIILLLATMFGTSAIAGEVEVVDAKARQRADGSYQFSVTLRHADRGWKHYADNWEILSPDGKVLGTRVLLHPHDNEQPFTRSLGGIRIPAGITRVRVRGHDKVHAHGGKELQIVLPGRGKKRSGS